MSTYPVTASQDFNKKSLQSNSNAQSDKNLIVGSKIAKNLNTNSLSQQSGQIKRKLQDDFEAEISESPHFKTADKRGQQSADISKVSLTRPTVSSTKSNVSRSLDLTPNFYETYKNLIESDSDDKPLRDVEAENNKLRGHLKELNERLTKFLTVSKIADAKPKRYPEFKDKSEEEQLNTIMQEMTNNEKILEIKLTEYNKLKYRLDNIKEPGYILKVEDDIIRTKEAIEKAKKENVILAHQTSTTGKNLNLIENVDGIPGNIKDANTKQREVLLLRRKLESLKEKNAKFDEERQTKSQKAQELNKQIEANGYQSGPHPKLIERYDELLKQSQKLEEAIKVLNTGREVQTKAKYKKALHDLELAVKKDKEFVSKLDDMISEQSTELKSMLDKESLGVDKTSVEMINKLKSTIDANKQSMELKSEAKIKPEPKKEIKEHKEAKEVKESKEVKEAKEKKEEPKKIPKLDMAKNPGQGNTISGKVSKTPDIPIDEDIDYDEIKKVEEKRKSPVKELKVEREVREAKQLKSPDNREQPVDFKEPKKEIKLPERRDPSPQREPKRTEDLQLPEFKKKETEKDRDNEFESNKKENKEELVLNDEFKPKKKRVPKEEPTEFEVTQKVKEEKEIVDPFAKFDNIDPLELTRDKKVGKISKDMAIDGSEVKPARKKKEENTEEKQEQKDEFGEVAENISTEKKKKKKKEDDFPPIDPFDDDDDDAKKVKPSKKDLNEEVFDLTKPADELPKKRTIPAKLEKLDSEKKPTVVENNTKIASNTTSKKDLEQQNDFFEDLDV